jgi:RecB family exonuclease
MKLSASKVERALRCPGSFSLPQVEEEPSEHAAKGSVIHAFLQTYVASYRSLSKEPGVDAATQARDEALTAVPEEHRLAAESMDLTWMHERLGLGDEKLHFMVELGMWWHPVTGKAELVDEHMQHGDVDGPEGSVTGIADLVITNDARKSLFVLDYKTGRSVTKAQENPQLLTLSTAANIAGDRYYENLNGAVCYVRDTAWFDHASWDVLDLAAHEEAVEAAMARIDAKDPTTAPGPWCKYCPAFMACPAKTALLRAAAEGYLKQSFDKALADRDMPAVYRALSELKGLTRVLEGQLRMFTDARGPIEVKPGILWGPHQGDPREYLKGKVVYDVLKETYSQEVALAAVELDATKTKLKEALRPVSKERKTPLAQLERAALTLIREKGGSETRRAEVSYGEYAKEK